MGTLPNTSKDLRNWSRTLQKFAAVSALLVLPSCGVDKVLSPNKDNNSDDSSTVAQAVPAAAVATGPKTYDLVADYKRRPVSVIIIRDGATRPEPYGSRINATLPILSSKIWNLASITGSAQVAVFDHAFFDTNPNDAIVPPDTAAPIVSPNDQWKDMKVLAAESMSANDFHSALSSRIGLAGGRGNGGTAQTGTVLAKIFEESKKEGGGHLGTFLAADRFVAVIYLAVNPVADAFEVADILALTSDRVGMFAVSALVPDKNGCMVAGTTPPRDTNPNKLPMRNLEIKLQEATGGAFGSICDQSYVNSIENIVNKGTGSEFFPVKLTEKIEEVQSIIAEGGTPITEYRFRKGTDTLELSTKIAPGSKFTVTAVVQLPPGEIVAGKDPVDNVPKPGASQLSPAEADFLTRVQPKLVQYCDGCHSTRPYSTRSGYVSALTFKADIARRINLPAGSPGVMPPSGSIPDADKAIILSWANQ